MSHAPRYPLLPLLSVLAVVPIATATNAATWYVDASAISDAGTSWKEPFHTIGEAVAAATDGDSVWVKIGEYDEELIIDRELKIVGGFTGIEVDATERDLGNHAFPNNFSGDFPAVRFSANSEIQGFKVSCRRRVAITIVGPVVHMSDCIITNSHSAIVGGGIIVGGESDVSLVNCHIAENTANGAGGGVYIVENSTVTMTDCVIEDNVGYGSGGGILCDESDLILLNCIIRRNKSLYSGGDTVVLAGGLRFVGIPPGMLIMQNTLIYDNEARERRQIIAGSPHMVIDGCSFIGKFPEDVFLAISGSVSNSIIAGATGILGLKEGGTYEITHSNIQGGYPGEGNISDDPMFRDPANGNFRLQHNSPCIDTGATLGPPDDLDGNPRPIDIPGVGRDGDNAFDMGAFEFQLPIPPPDPRTDINGDGMRDGTDLLLFIQDWMRASGPSAN